MREIKFRAWDEKEKYMWDNPFYEEGRFFLEDGKLRETCGPEGSTWCEGSPCILMQYTGLKDAKGKEIYEGDIVFEEDEGNMVVEWNTDCADYCLMNKKYLEYGGLTFGADIHADWLEVVGNIYENPELKE